MMDDLDLMADAYELQIFAVTGDLEQAETLGKLVRSGVLVEVNREQ